MKIKHLFLCLFTTLYCGSVLIANSPKEEGERISINNSHQTEVEALNLQKTRQEKAEEFERLGLENSQSTAVKSFPTQESSLASAGAKALLKSQDSSPFTNQLSTAGGLTFISYPGAYHPLIKFLGKEVRLEDGSWWKIYSGDFSDTYNWLTESKLSSKDKAYGVAADTVVVTANADYPLYSSYRYHLTNQQTGKYVRANLNDYYTSENTLYIISHVWLYDSNGSLYVQLTLSDGSIWNTLPIDTQCLDWHNGDIVIVGVNTDAFSSIAPYLLINVRTNNHGASACVLYYN